MTGDFSNEAIGKGIDDGKSIGARRSRIVPVEDAMRRYPTSPNRLPGPELNRGDYTVRFASTPRELDAVLRLRFEVFNLELGEGLDESYSSRRDRDAFDPYCHHAMVLSRREKRVVGTIRLQTRQMAQQHLGFYSAVEFNLRSLPAEALQASVEMGRACILAHHRNKQVLYLLWKALAHYMSHNQGRRLIGCCSLNSREPADGRRAMDLFRREGHLHPLWRVTPVPEYECPGWDQPSDGESVEIPGLFKTYLRYRARVLSPPALDRAFKTIDFFVLFDLKDLAPEKQRLFFD